MADARDEPVRLVAARHVEMTDDERREAVDALAALLGAATSRPRCLKGTAETTCRCGTAPASGPG